MVPNSPTAGSGMAMQGSLHSGTLPNLAVEAGAGAGAPCVRQLMGSLEQRLSKQLSDIDRKLDLLASDFGSNLEHLSMSLQKAQPQGPHSPHHPQQPATPAVPPSHAPSLGIYEAADGQSLANWIASYHASCGTPFGGLTDASTTDARPMYLRSNTGHRSGGESTVVESVPENMPECLLKRRPSLESNLSPLFQMMTRVRPSDWAQRMWTFLEDPDSSRAALWYSRIWAPFIAVTVLMTLLQTTQPAVLDTEAFQPVELCFDVIFMLEALLRYSVCPSSCLFARNPLNYIDILAAVPLAVRAPCVWDTYSCEQETWTNAMLFNVSPTVRLLKTLRHFQQFFLFVKLLKETREALSVLLFTLCIIVLAFSSTIYLVEPRDNISSLPKAMYMVIVTISTVGYGDVTPKSNAGSIVITATIVCSVLYMAMPIGIIGNAFTQIWTDRDRILMTVRTRDRLAQWGYTAKDMQMLFRHFDRNNNGELTLNEFRRMIAEMRIGIEDQDERVVQLFESFDRDGSGGIDEREFTRALFPSAYHELYSQPKMKPGAQVQENMDPTRFLRMNFPGRTSRRSDSKASEKSIAEEEPQNSPQSEAKGDGKGEAPPRFNPLGSFPSFHSGRSRSRSKGSKTSAASREKKDGSAVTPQGQDRVPKDSRDPPQGALMDVPPLFAVCC